MTMNFSARTLAGKVIYLAACSASIALLWQGVRFCQGHVGAPVVDQVIALTDSIWVAAPESSSSAFQFVMGYQFKALYFIAGVASWAGMAVAVYAVGKSFGRIIGVGFKKSKTEIQSEGSRIPS